MRKDNVLQQKKPFCVKRTRKNGVKIKSFFRGKESMRPNLTRKNSMTLMGVAVISGLVGPPIWRFMTSALPSFNRPAPSCIWVYYLRSDRLMLANRCESEQRINIRIPFGVGVGGNTGGNSCVTLPPGSIYWTRWWVGKFERVESCRSLLNWKPKNAK